MSKTTERLTRSCFVRRIGANKGRDRAGTRFDFPRSTTIVIPMKNSPRHLFLSACLALLWSGCASTLPNDAFVKTINFAPLNTFSYKHTLINGMEFRDSERMALEELSRATLTAAMRERGFREVESGSDFYVVAKWKKAVSSYPGIFASVDGARDSLNDRSDPGYRFASRLHLTVEVYETATGDLFWRNELPDLFDANEFTEERVVASLKRGIRDFPERVEKDPDLPNIE